MAYYLKFDGVNDAVSTPTFTPTSSSDWSFEVEVETGSNITNDQTILGNEFSPRTFKLYINGGKIGILHNSLWSVAGFVEAAVSINTKYIVKAEFDGSDIRLFFDGTQVALATGRTLSATQGNSHLNFIGASSASSRPMGANLYHLKVWDDASQSSLVRYYNPSATSGTGLVLKDTTAGGFDGTLVNFPTDDSQWVYYDAGGSTTASITESAPVFSDSITASYSANISASITESSQPFSDSITANYSANITSNITESSQPFSESITTDVASGLNINAAITESSQAFSDSVTAQLIGNVSAAISESAQAFSDSISVSTSANIAATVGESAYAFIDSITIISSQQIQASIAGSAPAFTDSVIARIPSKWIDVSAAASTWVDATANSSTWTDETNPINIWSNIT